MPSNYVNPKQASSYENPDSFPKYTETRTTKLSPKTNAELIRIANKIGQTPSELARNFIEKGILELKHALKR